MFIWEECVRRLEARQAECRKALDLLGSGKIRSGERVRGGPWIDTTQRDIERHQRDIAMYERLIEQVRAERLRIGAASGMAEAKEDQPQN
jgi:hypothetical protein